MLKLVTLILILTPASSLLAFSGKFSGTGLAKYATGREYPCSEIFLNLNIKNKSLYLNEGGYICGFLQAGFDNFKMDIRGDKLMYKDQELGRITDHEITYQIYDPNDGSTYYFNLTKREGQYHYLEEWHDGEKIALKVEGLLSPLRN